MTMRDSGENQGKGMMVSKSRSNSTGKSNVRSLLVYASLLAWLAILGASAYLTQPYLFPTMKAMTALLKSTTTRPTTTPSTTPPTTPATTINFDAMLGLACASGFFLGAPIRQLPVNFCKVIDRSGKVEIGIVFEKHKECFVFTDTYYDGFEGPFEVCRFL